MNYATAISNAIPSMNEIGRAVGDFIDPTQAIKREAERRRGMDIIMTSPNDSRYNIIRP
jgi:hypothetical protein